MSSRSQILQILADGRFHSGTELGAQLGVTRAAVNKTVQGLVERGLEIHSVSGKGYRWITATPLLDQNQLARRLAPAVQAHGIELHVHDEIESTSNFLVERLSMEPRTPAICLAESQTGGRGRRGRDWYATPYQNLVLSVSWHYELGPSQLSGLSIAAGVAVMRALQLLGIADIRLKWPNDILYQDQKLAGLLVDLRGEVDGPTSIVLGLGINVCLGAGSTENVTQPWVDLATITGQVIDRNELGASIANELVKMLASFPESGLQPYLGEWRQWHAFENLPVKLLQADREIHGIVCGLDETGALRLDTGEQILTVHSGEVSLRAG